MLNLTTKLNPNWVTGFTDAEGCFTTSIYKNKENNKWIIKPIFQIELNVKDIDILKEIKCFFKDGGKIYTRKNRNSVNYQVRDVKTLLEVIIPHFDKYILITQKYSDYILFKEIVKILNNKEHLTKEGLIKIISLKASLNNGISNKLQLLATPPLREVIPRVKVCLPDKIDYSWLAGFFSGDGCFFVNITKNTSCILGYSIKLHLSLTQHIRDEILMHKIVESLKCGNVYKHGKNSVVLRVSDLKELSSIFIPIFDKHHIKGVRYLDFKDFCLVASIIQNKMHLTLEGLNKIREIKLGMNKGRVKI